MLHNYLHRYVKKTRESPEIQEVPQNHSECIKRQNGGATGQTGASSGAVGVEATKSEQSAPTGHAAAVTSAKSRKVGDSSYSGTFIFSPGTYHYHINLRKIQITC